MKQVLTPVVKLQVDINQQKFLSDTANSFAAETLEKLGKWDKAIAAFNHKLQINPNYYWAYHCFGNMYVWQKKLNEDLFTYCKTIELKQDLAPSYKSLGDVLSKQDRVDKASEAYRQALKFDSQVI